jgi:hypothetical protein
MARANPRGPFFVGEWFAQLRFIPFAFGKPRCLLCFRFCLVVIAVLSSVFAQTCFCKYSLFGKIKTELCKKKYQQVWLSEENYHPSYSLLPFTLHLIPCPSQTIYVFL